MNAPQDATLDAVDVPIRVDRKTSEFITEVATNACVTPDQAASVLAALSIAHFAASAQTAAGDVVAWQASVLTEDGYSAWVDFPSATARDRCVSMPHSGTWRTRDLCEAPAQQPAAPALRKDGHVLYTRDDPDAPDVIKDRNGDIALALCKVCQRGEAELNVPCRGSHAPAPLAAAQPTDDELHAAWTDAINAESMPGSLATRHELAELRNRRTTWVGAKQISLRFALDAYLRGEQS